MLQASPHSIPDTAEPLARAYIDALARAEGVKIRSMVQRRLEVSDPFEDFLSDLDSDPDTDAPFLRADLAAAAVLTARAIAAEAGLAGRLRRGDGPVVVIDTHAPSLVDLVAETVQQCATSQDTKKKHIIARDGTDRAHNPERGNTEVVRALNSRWPIIGIAADPKRCLPSTMMRMAEYQLSLPVLDDWTVRLVLEAITGKVSAHPLDPDVVRILEVEDLNLSFRRGATPEQCLDRLADLVRNKSRFLGEGPSLEELDGYGDAKQWGTELAEDLREYRAGAITWSDVDHKGLLLSGPPGTGKTTFAKAMARSATVPLVATSVADWNAAPHLSGTLQAIRTVFSEAKRRAPSILFIDELDGISSRASLSGEYVQYWTQIVNALLECLAGVEDRDGVVVIAATNHPDKIDPAVLRAGRLDHHIVLQKPDVHSIAKIFRYHVGPDLIAGSDLMPAALAALGGTGADVEAWVRRAKATARRGHRALRVEDLLAQIRMGAATMSPAARRRVAVHEAGHAVVGTVLKLGPVVGVSIHQGGGMTEFESLVDGATTEEGVTRQIAMTLAGRAAEHTLLGDIGIGSGIGPQSDLAKATRMAQLLETHFGFGQFGNVFIGDGSVDNWPKYPGLIEAIRERLDVAFDCAMSILRERGEVLNSVSHELDRRGYLSPDDIDAILSDEVHANVSSAGVGSK